MCYKLQQVLVYAKTKRVKLDVMFSVEMPVGIDV